MANGTPSTITDVSRRLLAYEFASGQPADTEGSVAYRVCEQLRVPLAKLMGVGGYRSLLSRALVLAGAEYPCLRGLQIKADGSLEGLDELAAKLPPRTMAEGEAVLVSQLLGLLVTFIGPALTLRLLHDIWPKMERLNF